MSSSGSVSITRQLAWLLVLVGCQCKPSGEEPPSAKAPPLSSWQGAELSLEDDAGKATFAMTTGEGDEPPMAVKGFFSGLPATTVVEIGGKQSTAAAGADLRTETDVSSKAGPLALDDVARTKIDLDLALSITLPGHRPVTTQLPAFELGPSVAALFEVARKQNVRFPGEPEPPRQARAVAVLGTSTAKREMRVVGTAQKVWDIDWVAIEERLPEARERPCRGYNRRIDVVLKMHDSKFEVYDRRVAHRVAEKTFQAPGECPKEPLLSPDGSTHAYVRPDEVDAWLRSELGAK